MSQLAANVRAAGLMVGAMALYGFSDAMIKQVMDYAVNERGFDRKDIIHEKFFD